MADIIEMRHNIGVGENSSSSQKTAPPPPKMVKIKSVPVVSTPVEKKKIQEEIKDKERLDSSALFSKVNGYLTSKPLAPYIPPGIKPPSAGASMDVLEATYKQIQDGLKSSYKRRMVDMMFSKMGKVTEMAMVQFFQLDYAHGIADAMMERKDDFQPELEEMALELDESMVPGPKVRLGFKMLEFMDEYLSGRISLRNSNPEESNSSE